MTSFDTLSYAKVLQQGGIPTKQAEAMATGLLQYLKNEVATKSDIILLRAELKSDSILLRTEIKSDIAQLRTEIKVVYWVLGVFTVINVAAFGFVFSLLSSLLTKL